MSLVKNMLMMRMTNDRNNVLQKSSVEDCLHEEGFEYFSEILILN